MTDTIDTLRQITDEALDAAHTALTDGWRRLSATDIATDIGVDAADSVGAEMGALTEALGTITRIRRLRVTTHLAITRPDNIRDDGTTECLIMPTDVDTAEAGWDELDEGSDDSILLDSNEDEQEWERLAAERLLAGGWLVTGSWRQGPGVASRVVAPVRRLSTEITELTYQAIHREGMAEAARDRRDDLIRDALESGALSPAQISLMAGMTIQRVYQIRREERRRQDRRELFERFASQDETRAGAVDEVADQL